MCTYTYLHVWSPSLLVWVYIITYMHTEFESVGICLQICKLILLVFVYISTYIHTETTCVWVYIYIYVHHVHRCVYAEFTCMCACIYKHVRQIHMCVCIYLHICTRTYKCMHTCLFLYMCVWVYICMHICMWKDTVGAYRCSVCICKYMYTYLGLYVCVYVCTSFPSMYEKTPCVHAECVHTNTGIHVCVCILFTVVFYMCV